MILPARYPQASSRPQPFILVWVGEGMGGGNYGDFAPMRHHYPPSPPTSYFLWQSCKWNPSISLSPPALFLLNAGWQPILPLYTAKNLGTEQFVCCYLEKAQCWTVSAKRCPRQRCKII